MKTRWKILWLTVGLLAVITGTTLVTMHVQPQNEVEAYKKFLREQGEKLEISEVLPPPVPPESNSLSAVEAAFGLFGSGDEKVPDAMKMVAPGRALIGWRQPEVRGWNFTNSWDEFAAEVAANQPAIELLQQVLERPRLDFQLDYKQGAELQFPYLVPLRHAAQKLATTTIGNLHNDDTDQATTNILTLLGLVQKNETEGLVISHLVRITMAAIAVAPTWELLQSTKVTDAQFASVLMGWEQMNYLRDAEYVFMMERAWGVGIIQKARTSQKQLFVASGGSSSGWTWPPDWEAMTESPRYAIGEAMWRSSWSYSDELHMLQSDQIILETLRIMQTNRSQFYKADGDRMAARLAKLGITKAGMVFVHALKIPDGSEIFGDIDLSSFVRKAIRMEATRRIVVTAIALKRFHLQHGSWPKTLSELAPEFLPSAPIDPYDGQPLRYRANEDGTYLLYSVGEDGVDDGGDPTNAVSGSASLNWQGKTRDWVWPQPATAAEIQIFYDAQAKRAAGKP